MDVPDEFLGNVVTNCKSLQNKMSNIITTGLTYFFVFCTVCSFFIFLYVFAV